MVGISISIHVEVGDAPLDYNILLTQNWFYALQYFSSSAFWVIQFPLSRNIISIEQLNLFSPDVSSNTANNVPLLDFTTPQYQNI